MKTPRKPALVKGAHVHLMDWNRKYGTKKGYCVTNHALEGSRKRYEARRSVNGKCRDGRNVYDIAEGTCYMADIEFDAEGAVICVRYDLVRPARKV